MVEMAFTSLTHTEQQIVGVKALFAAGKACGPHLTAGLGQGSVMTRPTETETETEPEPQLDQEANPMQTPLWAGTAPLRIARTDHCIQEHQTHRQLQRPLQSRTPGSLKNRESLHFEV